MPLNPNSIIMPEPSTVSIETARLLRKHRFSEPVTHYYSASGEIVVSLSGEAVNWNCPTFDVTPRRKVHSAPPLALAQQWLREKKRFDVLVDREYFYGKVGHYFAKIIRLKDGAISETGKYRSYDKALESGILKALRML